MSIEACLYALYLRKSRKDLEAERNGIDTLERHEKILMDYAKQQGLKIGKIYREVVSGDTIAARPQMQALLADVENGLYKGVLVVEVERLARGDTIDQGIIAQVFKFSDTLIVTPLKTYDPNNEYDEEFFEYGLFQSRREYKAITRRQQRGIKQSIIEGKWPYNKAPYGYERYKLPDQKGYSLIIVEDKAAVVKQIFEWYAYEHIGYASIAERLNNMHTPAPFDKWSYCTVKDILTNIVYTGKVKRGERAVVKHTASGNLRVSRPRNNNFDVYDGLHEPIITDALYKAVQDIFKTHPSKPVGAALEIKNPLAGLVYCKLCGRKMIRRPQDRCKTMIICTTKGCPNISSYETVLEDAAIKSLQDYLDVLKATDQHPAPVPVSNLNILNNSKQKVEEEKQTFEKQLENAYDLVEQGVYTTELFLTRSQTLQHKIQDCDSRLAEINKQIKREEHALNKRKYLIPKIETILSQYDTLNPAEKNALLSEVIERIDYLKTERSPRNGPYDNFTISIKPHIPL